MRRRGIDDSEDDFETLVTSLEKELSGSDKAKPLPIPLKQTSKTVIDEDLDAVLTEIGKEPDVTFERVRSFPTHSAQDKREVIKGGTKRK
jgi:hypothetical protein